MTVFIILVLLVTPFVLLIWYIVRLILIALNRPYTSGPDAVLRSRGIAKTDLSPEGKVFLDGTLWNAVSDEGIIPKGTKITVVSIDGLELRVRAITRPKQLEE
jgi:membrane-bound serine protease (ClpP class)